MRHGETDWNVTRRIQGTQPVPINANGVRQIREACNSILEQPALRFAAVVTSPLLRARQSAEICCEILHAPVEIQVDFRERSFGDLEGKTHAEINRLFGIQDIEAFTGDAHGVEPVTELDKRLMHGIEILRARFRKKNVLVLTHGSVIKRIADLHGIVKIGIIPNGAYMQMDL
jgi:uncharacterized phosphatase